MCNMDSYPDPAIVGKAFVKQYYTQMHRDPSQMHRFYLDQSSFVHGGAEIGSEEPVIGQKAIHEKIESLDLKQVHAKIKQVDSHSTLGNGIVIQVTGELSSGGRPMRAFVQTFVLAPETPKKYYVHNDIFRYQDEDLVSESETNEASGDVETTTVNEQSTDGGDYLGGQETKVDMFPPSVDLDAVPGEQNLTSEPTELGGAGGVASWDQYSNDSTHAGGELQQNGISEEVESATTPQAPPTSSQEYVYESSVDHVTAEPVHEATLENEQFTPTEVESKPTGSTTWASRLAGKPQGTSQTTSQNRPLNSTIVSGSQALPQREPRSRRSDGGTSGGGGTQRQQQSYNSKDYTKKSGSGSGSGSGGGGMPNRGAELPPDAWQLFVGGLPPQTPDSEIRAVFDGHGKILDVRVNPKNFAFVVFDSPEPVQKIMAIREQFMLNGKRLNIELKRPSSMRYGGPRSGGDRDRQRSSGGGSGGGGVGMGMGSGGGGTGGMGGKPRNKGKR